jgi:hypothetical protein
MLLRSRLAKITDTLSTVTGAVAVLLHRFRGGANGPPM